MDRGRGLRGYRSRSGAKSGGHVLLKRRKLVRQGRIQPWYEEDTHHRWPEWCRKTIFALEYLPSEASCVTFINADLIAGGTSPFRPEASAIRAGRVTLELINESVRTSESLEFEATLSRRGYAKMVPRWQEGGWQEAGLVAAAAPNSGQRLAPRPCNTPPWDCASPPARRPRAPRLPATAGRAARPRAAKRPSADGKCAALLLFPRSFGENRGVSRIEISSELKGIRVM